MSDLKVLAVIPARGGSKGIKRKNLQDLGGKPLMAHMIDAAKASKWINRIIVSTEDEEIAETAKKLGVEVPFLRPKTLAEDMAPMIAVTKHGMEFMAQNGWKADIVVQLAIPCPYVPASVIDAVIENIASGKTTMSVTLKRIEHEHPYRAKELDENGFFKSFVKDKPVETYLSRQQLPTLYCTSGAVYAWHRDQLSTWSGKDFCFGSNPMGVPVSDEQSINIDRPIDLDFARFMADQKKVGAV